MKLGRRALMVSLAAALAGCGLRPLYGGGGDSGVQAELSSVAIPEPQTRLGQLIRNDLISAMRPQGTERYALLIVPSVQEETSVVNGSTDTLRLVVRVSASYTLSEVGSGKPLASGKTFSQTSYDETGQSFADKQAKADAMSRAAKEVAQDILARVSGYFFEPAHVTAVRPEAARAFLARSDTIGIVVYGNDEAKIADCIRSLGAPGAGDAFDALQLSESDLAGDPGRLLDELQSQSMFGGRTVIFVDRAGPAFLKAFELASSLSGARNAFVVNAGNLPKQNALRAKSEAAHNVGVIACYEDSPGEILEFVERLIAAARMPIEPDALQSLAALVGSSREAARSEVEKLLLYCIGTESIALEDVQAVCASSSDSGTDKLVDWMLAGSLPGADREFQALLDEGESAGRILNVAAQHVARLQDLQGEIAHGKTPDLAVKSARPPIFFKRAPAIMKQLRDWSPDQLEQLAASLNAAIFQCRTRAELEPAIASRALLAATRAGRR